MTVVALPGCRSTPLLSYLQGLGVLRILHEQHTPGLLSHWEGSTLYVESDLDREAIGDFFVKKYEPTPTLSPWNGGGGFRTLKHEKGEQAVAVIESSDIFQFKTFRTAIEKARQVWNEGLSTGWIEEEWVEDNGKRKYRLNIDKITFLSACRAAFPDEALDWLDTAAVLADEKKPQYPLLLGTGGNLGRLDLATNHMEALAYLLDPNQADRSSALLADALFEEGHPELDNKAVGQYSPGAAGTMNSWAFGSAESVANLWNFVLGMEGTLLFASGIARRFNGSRGLATVPFTVPNNSAGYQAAEGEKVKGEFWAPLWGRPLTVPEIRRVFAEGRISWGGRHAANGLDAAKALSTLGVDRGLNSFERYVIAERFGQSPLAVPVGTFTVTRQPADRVGLLGETDQWVNRVRRQTLPGAAASALRRVDGAQMDIVQDPNTPEPLQGFLAELAFLERIVSRNPDLRRKVGSPIPPLDRKRWGEALEDTTAEWRLAVAIATQRDRPPRGRKLSKYEQRSGSAGVFLRPVKLNENPAWKRPEWADRPPEYLSSRSVVEVLAAAMIIRSVLCRDRERDEDIPMVGSGSLVAFDRATPVGQADLSAFLNCRVNDQRLGRLISAASLLDGPPSVKQPTRPGIPSDVGAARAALGPFYHRLPIEIPTDDDTESGGEQQKKLLLPSLSWPQQIQAGKIEDVIREAVMRLQAAGFSPGIRPKFLHVCSPKRLLASLIIPVRTAAVYHGIRNVCPPPVALSEGETP